MKPKFMPALTGLRGAVALWVVAFHLGNFLPTRGAPVIGMGWIGVDVFFILSGFILAHVHLSDFERITGAGVRRFLALRLSRIYPVHLATLLAACALAAAMAGIGVHLTARFSVEALIANLALVQAWGFFGHDTFNVLAWSISAEWLAYLVFPLLALAVVRLRAGPALAVGALALLIEVATFRLLGRGLFVTSGLAPLRISGEFLCGMCLCVAFRSGRFDRLPCAITDFALLGLVGVIALRGTFSALPLMAVIVLGLAYGRGRLAAVLSTRSAIVLGEVSYSLYMVHLLTIEAVYAPIEYSRFVGSLGLRVAALPIALGVVALATVLMHRCVEVPFRQRFIGALAGRPVVTAP